MWRRGADPDGYVANFVETEQIMQLNGYTASFVQVTSNIILQVIFQVLVRQCEWLVLSVLLWNKWFAALLNTEAHVFVKFVQHKVDIFHNGLFTNISSS